MSRTHRGAFPKGRDARRAPWGADLEAGRLRQTMHSKPEELDATGPPDRPGLKVPPALLFFTCLVPGGLLQYLAPVELSAVGPTLLTIPGVAILALAGVLALYAAVVLKRHGTNVDPSLPTTTIVRRGPFRLTRNPMYLALVLALLGLAVLVVSAWFLMGAGALWWLLDRFAVRPEEAYLEAKFGRSFTSYAARVRRWI